MAAIRHAGRSLLTKTPDDVVILSAVRSPITRAFKGGFSNAWPEDILRPVMRAAADRANISTSDVNDVLIGNVLAELGFAKTGRMALNDCGFPVTTTFHTVNRQCASSLQAVTHIAHAIMAGQFDVGLAGGVESMTRNYTSRGVPTDVSPSLITSAVKSARDCLLPMGITSENVANRYSISRNDQDDFAYLSHQRAQVAQAQGRFDSEIVPVTYTIYGEDSDATATLRVDKDDTIRPNVTREKLANLKPAFGTNGRSTAGNSSQISDGASAMILARRSWAEARGLQPVGRFIGTQVSGCEPDEMGIGPVLAIPALLRFAGAELKDIDIIELNEAFASQTVYCLRELEMDVDKVNPNGGAIALGHPTGATGVRQAATLLAELKRTDKEMGIISMCARDVLNRHVKGHHDNDGTKVNATRSQPRPTEPVSPPEDTIIAQPTNLRDSSVRSDQASTNSSLSRVATPNASDETNNILQPPSDLSYTLHPVDPPSPSSSNDRRLSGTPPTRQQQSVIAASNVAGHETHHIFSLPDLMPTLSEQPISGPDILSCLDAGSLQMTLTDSAEAIATADQSGQRPQKRVCLSDHEMSQILTNYASRTWQPPPMGGTPDWLLMLDTDMASTDDRGAGGVWSSTTPLAQLYGLQHPDHSQTLHRRTDRRSSLGSDIPDERFARVSKLWSKTGERPWQLMQTLWSDVIHAPEDNLFSASGSDQDDLEGPNPILNAVEIPDRLDDRRRISLSKEYSVIDSLELGKMDFPTTDMLDICIDTYFQRFHHLMPIIHKPSFSSRKAPNMILLPIVLLGLTLLDSERTRSFVEAHLLNAIKKCDAALSRPWTRSNVLLLIQVLTSAILLLSCARTLEENIHSEQAFVLYTKTLSVAQQHGLFESHKGQPLSVVLDRGRMDSGMWKAWARVESAKRLISSLIMVDALFASNIGSGPMIRAETIHIYIPCSTLLFAATDAERWAQTEATSPSLHHPTLDFRALETKLPADLSSSSIAMTTLMSAVWLRFADVRHRLLLKGDITRQPTLFPGEVYEEDASGITLVRLVRDIQSTFREDLSRNNPNDIVFWHRMCMSISANIEIFEIAAGRDGAHEGKAALEHISTWAQTSFARRACLHAAQTYAAMSRRRVVDGTAFMTEMAIFHSALVLGLYCYAAPDSLREGRSSEGLTSYELLDDVDWDQLGDAGFHARNVSCARPLNAAELFVLQGGAITFSGVIHEGGFNSSRRIFLAFIGLLEEVGKWKAGEYCRILRLMSDSNLDLGMH